VFDSDATVASGIIYVVSNTTGTLDALRTDSTLSWSFSLGGETYAAPALFGRSIVIPIEANPRTSGLFFLNSAGSLVHLLHSPKLASFDFANAVGPDGAVYQLTLDGFLAKLLLGRVQWTTAVAPTVNGNYPDFWASPAISGDGTVYVNSMDGNLYSISPQGSINWTLRIDAGYSTTMDNSSPAVSADGTVYVGSFAGTLYAVNPDGTVKWTFDTGSANPIYSSPAIGANGWVYFASENLGVGNATGTLYALH
jgi:outer membrane protein assembly factor BamB